MNVHQFLALRRYRSTQFILCDSKKESCNQCIPKSSEESNRAIVHTRTVKIVCLKNKNLLKN